MLSSTEKILSVVVLALTLAVVFSLIQYGSAMDEMAQLRSEQAEHVDMVNKEFKQRFKPWITAGLRTSIKRKHSLFKKFIKH